MIIVRAIEKPILYRFIDEKNQESEINEIPAGAALITNANCDDLGVKGEQNINSQLILGNTPEEVTNKTKNMQDAKQRINKS